MHLHAYDALLSGSPEQAPAIENDGARRTPMSTLEAVVRRDRNVVIGALLVVTALAWADLVWLANDMWMDGMDMAGFRMIPAGQGWMMPVSAPWGAIEFGAVFVMWVV